MRRRCFGVVFLAWSGLLALSIPAAANSLRDRLKDPEDGWLDASRFLLDGKFSFLPVPIIISEPAVDGGLGTISAVTCTTSPASVVPREGSTISRAVRTGSPAGRAPATSWPACWGCGSASTWPRGPEDPAFYLTIGSAWLTGG